MTNIEKKIEEIFPHADTSLNNPIQLRQVYVQRFRDAIESGQLAFGISKEELTEIIVGNVYPEEHSYWGVSGCSEAAKEILKKKCGVNDDEN